MTDTQSTSGLSRFISVDINGHVKMIVIFLKQTVYLTEVVERKSIYYQSPSSESSSSLQGFSQMKWPLVLHCIIFKWRSFAMKAQS